MHHAPALGFIDFLGPAIAALGFILGMSLVREPTRRHVNAIVVAGVSGAYLSGGFGLWELWYPVVGTAIAYLGLRSHRYIGIAWLMHAAWDLAHHLYGNPIWPFMPTSSFGCLIFDTVLATWFLAGAPALLRGAAERGPGSPHPAMSFTLGSSPARAANQRGQISRAG